ncbi:MAG TPA: thioredoxin domain-containing protein [Cyclobacteriaceae bacterium]
MANKLIHSTSPYLLQHAHNPVHWNEWGTEALDKAKKEDKPILVSIGYSSCHWCHVMERESFENQDIAAIMNEHFICIKVDREERPDIDQVYMEAVQVMGMNGGWPLNVFLTPEQKPFYGGTYFPPQNWAKMLTQIHNTFKQRREEINTSANELTQHLGTSDLKRFSQALTETDFKLSDLDKMFSTLESKFDNKWGGMDKAPKFVMPSIWLFLLRYHAITKNQKALDMVNLTLSKMAMAGLYDQIGGGFARYSVDGEWFAPHFEKMLYDNAQLLSLYSEAFALTKNKFYKDIVYETVEWLRREMTHEEGGFYSAQDADSEGIEGKFYTWTFEENEKALGNQAKLASDFYQLTSIGNWEHGRNILLRKEETEPDGFAAIKQKMLSVRNQRIHPGLDDKILSGWNAMNIVGLIDAYKAFGEKYFLDLAEKGIQFIEKNLISEGVLHRSFKNKHSITEGFLEDHAYLISAYINLYQATFKENYLTKAQQWTNFTLENFFDREENYFHFSGKTSERLIASKKEIFDNVIPSSNSVMAHNLFQLGTILDREDWKMLATKMVSKISNLIISEPDYTSNWGIVLSEITKGMAEVVVMGKEADGLRSEFHQSYQPFALTMGSESVSQLPLLKDRNPKENETLIYVCYNKTCKLPVKTVAEALDQL